MIGRQIAVPALTLQRSARRQLRRVPVVWFFGVAVVMLAAVVSASLAAGDGAEGTAAAHVVPQ